MIGECRCIDCGRENSPTWVCPDCQRKRDEKPVAMTEQELQEIKELALKYGDPLRGKMLAMKAEAERLREERDSANRVCIKVMEENKRLRKALGLILSGDYADCIFESDVNQKMRAIARQALEGKE
jgi:hypothetical protein